MTQLLHSLPRHPAQSQQVSVLMLDLVGSTRLARELPLEHYALLMTDLVQLLILSCEAWGGEVLQHLGDGVVACWPSQRSVQVVRCALEAPWRVSKLELARQLGLSLQVRGGISHGPVIMGEVGSQITAYGLPLNLARRMCDAAQPGEILVCSEVRERCLAAQTAPSSPLLAFRPHPNLPHLRGFAEETEVLTASVLADEQPYGQPGRMKVV